MKDIIMYKYYNIYKFNNTTSIKLIAYIQTVTYI